MNIFVLDNDIKKCAHYHCDQHVIKMILESTQILCTALNLKGYKTPYKSTHTKHPCVKWVGKSYSNFKWLTELAYELNGEYKYRYEKDTDHKSIATLESIQQYSYEDLGLMEFVQAMPEEYKVPGDPVQAYRNFYNYDKSRFATWTKRPQPPWFQVKYNNKTEVKRENK
ncbi:MAG: pyrimidine dimer DNA glycosylase/endonuclease V [Candidatus Marinimicrobia bacterium]|nr:pyrimidine dimer DNA glycosylase/endonuclease V [Candidatus Neomarinimicrobiota bacterium]